jgi:hypothetical protein
VFSEDGSCRETVRKFLAWLAVEKGKTASASTAAYCQARGRLSLNDLVRTSRETALRIEQEADGKAWSLWCGRRVRVADGSGVSMPDTPENQKKYPQSSRQKPGCGFPVMRIVALFSLATGVMLEMATGSLRTAENKLMRSLWRLLESDDVLLTDRAFSSYAELYLLAQRGVDCVSRRNQRRKPSTGIKRLGKNDYLVQWRKMKACPKGVSKEQWSAIPKTMVVREIEIIVEIPGFRTHKISVATTLLDPTLYPAEAIAQLYLWRWRVELFLRDIKITMGMDILRCKTPEMVQKELRMRVIAYNLIRALMLEASTTHHIPIDRLSFKGTLATVRHWAPALADSREPTRSNLHRIMLAYIATDLVPLRPYRTEPRAKKRRPKGYQLLGRPRNQFKEIAHRNRYRKALS